MPFAVPEWIEDATLAGAPLASYTANHQETYRDTQARPPLPPLIGPKRESWSGQYPSFVRLLVHFCLRHCGCVPSSRASLYLALLSHSSHSPLSLSLTHALSFSISVSSGPWPALPKATQGLEIPPHKSLFLPSSFKSPCFQVPTPTSLL